MSIADAIRAEITATRPSNAVLDLHPPRRIYGPCGHDHQPGEPGTRDLDEVGTVCEDGYLYTVCGECCTNDYGQHSVCAEEHGMVRDVAPCWPCPTVKTVATGLGINPSEEG